MSDLFDVDLVPFYAVVAYVCVMVAIAAIVHGSQKRANNQINRIQTVIMLVISTMGAVVAAMVYSLFAASSAVDIDMRDFYASNQILVLAFIVVAVALQFFFGFKLLRHGHKKI